MAGKAQIEILKKLRDGYLSSVENLIEAFAGRTNKATIRSLNGLVKEELIVLGGERIYLSKRGKKLLSEIEKSEIAINIMDEWDGLWRIVAYDIPEELKKERDWFRRKLVELKFTKVQGSMWLYPYECKEEIAVLAQGLRLSPFVMYLTTDFVPGQQKYLKKYHL